MSIVLADAGWTPQHLCATHASPLDKSVTVVDHLQLVLLMTETETSSKQPPTPALLAHLSLPIALIIHSWRC